MSQRGSTFSAIVSDTTKDLLDRYARASGIKKGHLIEQALRHHLQALQELPAGFIVRPHLVVSKKAGEKVLEQIAHAEPTDALRSLMHDGD